MVDIALLISVCASRFSKGKKVSLSPHGQGSGRTWMKGVDCSGTELSLTNCSHDGLGVAGCNHYSDLALRCYNEGRPFRIFFLCDITDYLNTLKTK